MITTFFTLGSYLESIASDRYLTDDEQTTLQIKKNTLLARKGLRFLLARYLSTPIKEARIAKDSNGKPYLPDHNLHISISHSGNAYSFAISFDGPVGIDIEHTKRPANKWQNKIRSRFTMPNEKPFLYHWTRVEAAAKLHGKSIFNYLGKKYPASILTVMVNIENNQLISRPLPLLAIEKGSEYYVSVAWG